VGRGEVGVEEDFVGAEAVGAEVLRQILHLVFLRGSEFQSREKDSLHLNKKRVVEWKTEFNTDLYHSKTRFFVSSLLGIGLPCLFGCLFGWWWFACLFVDSYVHLFSPRSGNIQLPLHLFYFSIEKSQTETDAQIIRM
jgi:hypothetical protein